MEDSFFWLEREIATLKYKLQEQREIYIIRVIVYSIVSFILGIAIAL